MAMQNVLVVGGTGYLGRHLVAALREGRKTPHVLVRPETVRSPDPQKKALLDEFREANVRVHEGALDDHASLERACAEADAVISAVTGPQLAQQPALVRAARKAGRPTRFFPSEFGVDPYLAAPGSVALFDWKRGLHESFNASGIAVTYVYSNGFATYWAAGLGQLGPSQPPRDEVTVFGDGSVKAAMLTVEDIARFTVRMLDDPHTANRETTILPKENQWSQNDMIDYWEHKARVQLRRNSISSAQLDSLITRLSADPGKMMDMTFMQLARSVWIEGSAATKRPEVLDAAALYPDVRFTRVSEFLDRFAGAPA